MNIDKRHIHVTSPGAATRSLILCGATLLIAPIAFAQDEEEEIFELSPFTVEGTENEGYRATSTLAGTRIRTDLKDVGSAISVYTDEFLGDIGATDSSTLLQYTTNTEVGGTRGSYAGFGNGATLDETDRLRNPNTANRVRGLDAADNTRDFFITDVPWDSYNVDRIDLQRGPNSILFGLGSPAGIINATMATAALEDSNEVEVRFGSYGSRRASVSLNRVLIEDVLAVRVAGLWDHEKFQQDPAFENDERYYAAIRWEPKLFADDSMRTTIHGKFEHGSIKANRPRILPPNDSISAWFRPNTTNDPANPFGGMGKLTVNTAYDLGSTASTVNRYLNNTNINQQQPFWLIDGDSGQVYDVKAGYINNGARTSAGVAQGTSQNIAGRRYADQFIGIAGLDAASKVGPRLENAQFGQYKQMSMTDDSIFDFYNTLIDGDTKSEGEEWNTYNLDFAQTAFDDRLGLQLTYDRQEYERGGESLLGGSPAISVDINEVFQDLTANPNVGRPYVTSNSGGTGTSYESEREYLRASLFAEVRASDYFDQDSLITRILGRHRFNGVYSAEKYGTENRAWNRKANSQAWAGYWNLNDGSTSGVGDRPPVGVIYLGPSVGGLSTASGANIPGIGAPVDIESSTVQVFDSIWNAPSTVAFDAPWTVPSSLYEIFPQAGFPTANGQTQWLQNSNPANYVGWNRNRTVDVLSYDGGLDPRLLTRAQLSMRETTSHAISWQGFLWDGAIVPTLGWRHDEVKGKGFTSPQLPAQRGIRDVSPSVYRLPDEFPDDQIFKAQSTSGGVVVHLNQFFSNDPLPINVSLSYNKSSNFQVTDTRRDLYGNPIDNPTGDTKDYGVLLSTKDGRYSFRAVKYESHVEGASSGLNDAGGIGRVIHQGLKWRNVFLYDLSGYDWPSRGSVNNRHEWAVAANITPEAGRALEDAAIDQWNAFQAVLEERGWLDAWGITPVPSSELTNKTTYDANPAAWTPSNTSLVYTYTATQPQGFTVTADTESKGYEFEFMANPTDAWRIAINASKTEAFRSNVGGPQLDEFIGLMDDLLIGTAAGNMPQFGNAGLSIVGNEYNPWRANYAQLKLAENTASPELRKWRYNIITNYDFQEGPLSGLGVGGSYRWQDKVAIGYPLVPLSATEYTFDVSNPFYGPTEDAIDLWVSYERPLSDSIDWRIQLNIRNAFADEDLIPISLQPDNVTWGSARIAPVQEWFVTNTFSF